MTHDWKDGDRLDSFEIRRALRVARTAALAEHPNRQSIVRSPPLEQGGRESMHSQLQGRGVLGLQPAGCTGFFELAIQSWRTSKHTFAHLGHGVIRNGLETFRIRLAAHRLDE